MNTVPNRQHDRIRGAFVRGLIVGLIFQLFLIPTQALIEPAYVWVEVTIGTMLSFAIAEFVVIGEEPSWREYRNVLITAFVGQAFIIVPYEILLHLVLPSMDVTF